MNDIKILTDSLEKMNISLSDDKVSKFLRYYEMLVETNKVMNLTAITEFDEVMIKHFADSLSIVKLFDLSSKKDIKILDIGTGAGFPGIPLKIAFPDIRITLLDSLTKRIRFIDDVINELDLNSSGSIETTDMRSEDYVRTEDVRESFDLVVSRAVANLAVLSEYSLPYVRIGGSFISYKGDKVSEELNEAEKAIDILGGEVNDVMTFTLPGTDISRTLINIKKTRPTPDKYPRKAGLPNKKPLL
ncbi:MAG: 16S rRNA (guanine(527)-N(7))-methyltransferase RsmG [Lachnospiraceae bacterium]|nr:16S rRNA (guanine(527)-N(7))-methyltransferase RsmG [Lachnospiraceae bacterium]